MSLFNNKPTPVRLHKKVSWREKYEVEIINPAELNSFFDIIKQIIQKNQVRIVKALMEELCAEKNMDYDEYILNAMFRKISENGQFKEIMDLMTKL